MFRITEDPSSVCLVQCVAKNYENDSTVFFDMKRVGVMAGKHFDIVRRDPTTGTRKLLSRIGVPRTRVSYTWYLFLTNNFPIVHSNSSISETVRNRTHVHINIFA
jgi:hypothetical protein